MPKRNNFFYVFLSLLFLSLIVFGASKIGLLKPLDSLGKGIISPAQALTYGIYTKITGFGSNSQTEVLKAENLLLTKKLIDQNKLVEDNKALRDQFQAENPKSLSLTQADVIGAPGFIPGISVPDTLILDRGENDGVKVGQAVVYADNLIGKIVKTSAYISSAVLISNSASSFTAKTMSTQALGVVEGQGGGGIILNDVVLSDTLQKQDTVLTKGDVNAQGIGIPPNLVVGEIISVSKFPSDLFQKADIKAKVDFSKLTKVFIVVNNQ
jgi:rod shape-determining protein MreC